MISFCKKHHVSYDDRSFGLCPACGLEKLRSDIEDATGAAVERYHLWRRRFEWVIGDGHMIHISDCESFAIDAVGDKAFVYHGDTIEEAIDKAIGSIEPSD